MRFAAAILALALVGAGAAHAEACLKSGDEAGPIGAVCYYRCSFGTTTLNVGPGRVCPMTAEANPAAQNRPPPETGGACMKQGERTDGMSKECIYDCTGTRKVVTIGSAQLCPLTAR